MRGLVRQGAFAAVMAGALAVAIPVAAAARHDHVRGGHIHRHVIKHVLLISVDGLHQSDLDWYVANHPDSELAKLTDRRRRVHVGTHPGSVRLGPGDDRPDDRRQPEDDRRLLRRRVQLRPAAAGDDSCHGQPTGANVIYDSPDDIDSTRLDAGQGLSGLPGSILQHDEHSAEPARAVDVPGRSATCKPIYPHSYLKVNTIFNVAHDAGLLTAWSDKHPVYESFNGPEGNGIDDQFDPEIDSYALKPNGTPYPGGIAWTGDNAATMQYDSYKVQAVINWIDGYNHSRTQKVGVPAIFGMNFQTVSTAEKLPTSDGLTGGDLPGH